MAMSTLQLKVIVYGVRSKIRKGEDLEEILNSYINLTEDEKQYVRTQVTS